MGDVIEMLRELRPGMRDAQRTVADLLVADPVGGARLTILELADRCQVSTGSITRLCRTLGLSGYPELRLELAGSGRSTSAETWAADIGSDLTESDSTARVAAVISAAVGQAIADTINHLDLDRIDAAATKLAAARRIEVYGVGGSASMADEFQQRLYRIGIAAWFTPDAHVALTGAALLGPNDVVVVISHSGRSREVIDLVTEATSRGAATVAICDDPRSPVGRRADLVLRTTVRDSGFHTEAIVARHAQLAVLDVLYIAIAQRTYDQTTEAMAATTEAVQPYKTK